MKGNGGRIGYPNIPTRTVASGIWSLGSAGRQLAGHNAGLRWPTLPDPYFSSVTALYHFDGDGDNTGSAGATTNLFYSVLDKGNGIVWATTPAPPWGKYSFAIGSGGSHNPKAPMNALTVNAAYTMGSGDYVIEGLLYTNDLVANVVLFDGRPGSGEDAIIYVGTNGAIKFYLNGADRITSSASVVTTTTWLYWALARVSGTTRLYCGAVSGATVPQVGSNYTDANTYANTSCVIGTDYVGTAPPNDVFMREYRFTKGNGRGYTGATIATPTGPWPDY